MRARRGAQRRNTMWCGMHWEWLQHGPLSQEAIKSGSHVKRYLSAWRGFRGHISERNGNRWWQQRVSGVYSQHLISMEKLPWEEGNNEEIFGCEKVNSASGVKFKHRAGEICSRCGECLVPATIHTPILPPALLCPSEDNAPLNTALPAGTRMWCLTAFWVHALNLSFKARPWQCRLEGARKIWHHSIVQRLWDGRKRFFMGWHGAQTWNYHPTRKEIFQSQRAALIRLSPPQP